MTFEEAMNKLEEMAGNIIKYGYDVAGERIIEIEIAFGGRAVTLTLRDHGRPFNPLNVPEEPEEDLPPMEDRLWLT